MFFFHLILLPNLAFRLACQLVPKIGILFLVLPTRCINSKHVGGLNNFSGLLRGIGLRDLLPVRNTPKLTFFILGNNPTPDATLNINDASQHNGATAAESTSAVNKAVTIKATKKVKGKSTVAAAWVNKVQIVISENIKSTIYRHFTKDYSEAKSNEFALALPDVVTTGLSLLQ